MRVRVNQGTGWATVYAWTIPAQVAGTWTLTTPEGRRVTLQLRQQFQRFTGPGGVSGRLVGDRIEFTLTERVNGRPVTRRFSGRVTGDGMSGTVGGGAWRAVKVPPGAPQ